MKNKIMNKLRSTSGASITFALLLFLVCTILCSVIITAATAASGRMSKIAESDQRYYAVTSAAELLKDILDGKSVSVVRVEEVQNTTIYTAGNAGTPTPDASTQSIKTYVVPDKKAGGISEADFTGSNTVGDVGYTNDSIHKDTARNIAVNADGTYIITPATNSFELTTTHGSAGLAYDALAATISEKLSVDDDNGDTVLTFEIYNKYKAVSTASSAGTRYTVVMTFKADTSATQRTKSDIVSSTPSGNTVSVVTKDTKMTIVTFTWKLTGIRFSFGA